MSREGKVAAVSVLVLVTDCVNMLFRADISAIAFAQYDARSNAAAAMKN